VLTVQVDEVDGPKIKAIVVALRIAASEAGNVDMKVRHQIDENTRKTGSTSSWGRNLVSSGMLYRRAKGLKERSMLAFSWFPASGM
jgi:hypothetical protein